MDIPDQLWPPRAVARPRTARAGVLPRVALRFSERRLLLAGGDLLVLNLSLLVSLVLRPEIGLGQLPLTRPLLWCTLISLLWFGPALWLNVYDLPRAATPLASIWWTSGAMLVTTVVFLLAPWITPVLPVTRLELVTLPALAVALSWIWRIAYVRVFAQPAFCQQALVVGAGWAGTHLAQTVAALGGKSTNIAAGTGYSIIGFVDDDPQKANRRICGMPVLGTRADLLDLVRRLQPDELVVAITRQQTIDDDLFRSILDCRALGVPVTTMTSVYERLTGRVAVKQAGHDLHVVLPLETPMHLRLYLLLRRLLDMAVGAAGCLAVALLVPLVWLSNQLCSPGDIFYRQERMGKSGRVISIVKFRSMVMHAERYSGAVWASERDPRITPLGRLLRKTRIDELPQFWNVLCGDMSLIGPRPERPDFVAQLNEEFPVYRARHAVAPGLTGWAQVMYRYGSSVEDSLIKLKYDLYYIKHQGPYLDLLIVLKTVRVVCGLMGR
jgi:exopolysaccharide biosynthesis polyprenyl glycosylphosphotransferase